MVKFLQEFAEDFQNMEAELARLDAQKRALLREHTLLNADFKNKFGMDLGEFRKREAMFAKEFISKEKWETNLKIQYDKALDDYKGQIADARSHSTWSIDIPEPIKPNMDDATYQEEKREFEAAVNKQQSLPNYHEMKASLEAIKVNEQTISNVSYHIKDLRKFGEELMDKRSQFYLDTLKSIVTNSSFWKNKGTFIGFMRSEPNTIKELKKILNSNQSMSVKISRIDSLKYYKLRDKHHDTRHADLKQLLDVIQSPKKLHDSHTDLTDLVTLSENINKNQQEEKFQISPRRRSP